MTGLALGALVALVGVNALFVATEFALVAARPGRLEEAIERGSRLAARGLRAQSALRLHMSCDQLGITASSIAVGILAAPALGGLLAWPLEAAGLGDGAVDTTSWVLAIVLAAFVQMLLGEMVPKNLAIAQPERTLSVAIGPHLAFLAVFRPLVVLLDRAAALCVRPFGLTPVDEVDRAVGVPELAALLRTSHDERMIKDFEHDLLSGALDLGRLTVASVMVPRADVVVVGGRDPVGQVEWVMTTTGLSRIPLLDDDGAVRRFVHVRRVLALPSEARNEPLTMESTRPLYVIQPDVPLDEALHRLRHWRQRLALVRTAGEAPDAWQGVVSVEDVVERLVGDIRDETEGSDETRGREATRDFGQNATGA